MSFDQFRGQRDTLLRRNVRESNKPRMWYFMQIDELPEVGVNRDKNSPFGLRPFQQRPIPRIATEFSTLDYIVPAATEPVRQTATGAPVDKESHGFFNDTAASVSPAMTARA